MRFLEFFGGQHPQPNTRRAYYRAAGNSWAWCASVACRRSPPVQPVHVRPWIEAGRASSRRRSSSNGSPRFRSGSIGCDPAVVPVNGRVSARVPHVVTSGKRRCSILWKARALLGQHRISTHAGLARSRPARAHGLFLRPIGAGAGMAVEDVFMQNRRLWVRLREGAARGAAMPCHHNLEETSRPYLDGAVLWRDDPKGAVFRTIGPRQTGKTDAHRAAAGERLCNDPPARGSRPALRPSGQSQLSRDTITAYLKNAALWKRPAPDGEPTPRRARTALRSLGADELSLDESSDREFSNGKIGLCVHQTNSSA